MQVDTTSSVLIRTTSCFLNICVGFEAEEGGIEEGKDREREGESDKNLEGESQQQVRVRGPRQQAKVD